MATAIAPIWSIRRRRSSRSFWEDRFADKRGTYIASNELFQTWFIMSSLVFGEDEYDIEAGLQAVQRRDADEDQRLHRQHADAARARRGRYLRADRLRGLRPDRQGRPGRLDVLGRAQPDPDPDQGRQPGQQRDAEEARLRLRQSLRAARSSRRRSPTELYLRPTNKNVVIPENLASKGVENTEDAATKLWIPDWNWYVDHDGQGDPNITERVNEIIA